MRGDLRPSAWRGVGLRLLNCGLSLLAFAVGLGALCLAVSLVTGSWGAKARQVETKAPPGAAKVDPSAADGGTAVATPKSAVEKFAEAAKPVDEAGSHIYKKGVEAVQAQYLRDDMPIPHDAFAYLVENLLGRGSGVPQEFNSVEKCLQAGIPRQRLNRPIGILWWKDYERQENLPHEGERSAEGPTYNLLMWDAAGAGGEPPKNCLVESFSTVLSGTNVPQSGQKDAEATVLTLADVDQIHGLIEAGADPNLRFGRFGDTALIDAARRGDLPRINALLNNGADKNASNAEDGGKMVYAYDVLLGFLVSAGPSDPAQQRVLERLRR